MLYGNVRGLIFLEEAEVEFMSSLKKFESADLINVGMFTAVIVIIMLIIIPIGFILVLMPLYCVLIPLFTGLPFMLFLTRVRKFGLILLMSIVLSLVLLLTGMGWYSFPVTVVSGLIAEVLVRAGGYRSIKLNIAACGIFSLWCFGSFIPLFFFADDFWAQNAEYGEEYIAEAKGIFHMWLAPVLVLSCIVCGSIGAVAGSSVIKKHFVRSGVI